MCQTFHSGQKWAPSSLHIAGMSWFRKVNSQSINPDNTPFSSQRHIISHVNWLDLLRVVPLNFSLTLTYSRVENTLMLERVVQCKSAEIISKKNFLRAPHDNTIVKTNEWCHKRVNRESISPFFKYPVILMFQGTMEDHYNSCNSYGGFRVAWIFFVKMLRQKIFPWCEK